MFGLQKDQNPAYNAPGGVPAEGAGDSELGCKAWPSGGDDEVEGPIDGRYKTHPWTCKYSRIS